MSGYVMCYVAHEAVLGLTDLKCYTVLPDSLVYATSIYFHVFWQARRPYIVSWACPSRGTMDWNVAYTLSVGTVSLAVLRGLDTWPYARLTRTVWQVGTYKHLQTADVWRMGSIMAGPLSRCPVPVVPLPVSRWRVAAVGDSMFPAPAF